MLSKKIGHWPIILIICLLVSCSDAKKEPETTLQVQDARFSTSCKLDTEKLKKFFEEDVSQDIYCLKENLNLFMKVVATEKPGHLSQVQLKQFILDRKSDIDPKTQLIIDLIYDVVYLIYGGEQGQISSKNVSDLTNFLLDVNYNSINIYRYFNQESNITFKNHLSQKEEMRVSLLKITNLLQGLTNLSGTPRKISLVAMLDLLGKIWPDKPWGKWNSILPFKPLLVAGSQDYLTTKEWHSLLGLADDLTVVAFDLLRFSKIVDKNNPELIANLKNDVLVARKILDKIPWGQSKVVFKLKDVAGVVDTFYEDIFGEPKNWTFQNFLPGLGKIKAIIADSEGDFSGKDLTVIFDRLHEVAFEGEMIYRLWALNESALLSKQKYNGENWNWGNFNLTNDFKNKVLRIVKNYKFYRGDRTAPFITHFYSRNATGIFEFALWEYGINLLFKKYGCRPASVESQCLKDIGVKTGIASGIGFTNEYVGTLASIKNLFSEVGGIIVSMGLMMKEYIPNTAENIALLASLFMYQSNGDSVVQVNEGAEFFIVVFSAINAGTEMHKELSKICRVSLNNRIEPKCYRRNFMDIFTRQGFNDTDYSKYLPIFFSFIKSSPQSEIDSFVLENERAAMICPFDPIKDPNDQVPKSKGDLLTSFVTIFSIEATVVKFDANKNNILDSNEILGAFNFYRPAVEGIISQKLDWLPLLDGFTADVVYRFLIAEKRVPEAGDALRLAQLKLDCSSCSANRETIASILKNIKNNSPENIKKPFNCETLKD